MRAGGLIDIAREEMQRAMESRKDDELSEYDYARKLESEGVNEWNMLEAEAKEEGEAEAETVQRIFDEMRKRFSPDLNIELADTASLPEGLRERVEKKKGAEGVWSNGKIYLLSDRIRAGRVRKVFIHEAAAHEGLRRVFGERYDDFLREVLTEFSDGVSETARRRGIDITTAAGQLEAADEYLARLAEERIDPENPGERGSIWKRILYKFRAWLRRHGFDIGWTDNELTELLRAGARAVAGKRYEILRRSSSYGGQGEESSAALARADKPDRPDRPDRLDRFAATGKRLAENIVAKVPSKAIMAGNGKTAIEAAMEYVRLNNRGIYPTKIGDVEFDESGVKSSLSHTMYQNKLDALQAVPQVLMSGEYLGSLPDKDGKPSKNHYFAGKVKIGNDEKIVFIRTLETQGRSNRFYVHEVFTEDEIRKLGSQQTDATLNNASRKYRNASEFYRNIIAQVMNVNDKAEKNARLSVDQTETEEFKRWFGDSKVVDENGDPLVVYHDTNAKIYVNKETGENWDDLDWKVRDEWESRDDWDEHWKEQDFYTFSRVRARRSIEYPGFFFTPNTDPYHEYGSRRIAAYLSIQNPAINPTIENAGVYDDSGEAAMKKLIEQGYDGVIRTDDKGNVEEYIAFFPEQIKSATDNIGTYDPGNPDIRFSAGEDPGFEAKVKAISKVLFRYTGTLSMIEPEEAYDILSKKGWKIDLENDEELLRRGAVEAMMLKRERSQENRKKREKHAVTKADEWTGLLMEKYGEDFKINAGPKYDEFIKKEPFTGTWIDRRKTERGRAAPSRS